MYSETFEYLIILMFFKDKAIFHSYNLCKAKEQK